MNDRYFDIINELHHSFIDNLNELKSILDDLLNLDSNVTDEQLLELRRKTQEVIACNEKRFVQRLYINALLTDVTTPEEKQNLNKLARQNQEIRQMQKDTIQEIVGCRCKSSKILKKNLLDKILAPTQIPIPV